MKKDMYQFLKRFCKFFTLSFVLVAMLSITGCVGMIARGVTTGKKYSEAKTTIQPIPSGYGRLFVYLVDGGPNIINTLGVVSTCTVDRQVCEIAGKSYFFIDLLPGRHKVTSGSVNGVIGLFGAKYGKYAEDFDLGCGKTKYCRLDLNGFGAFTEIKPIMVSPSVAEQELETLPFKKFYKMKKMVRE